MLEGQIASTHTDMAGVRLVNRVVDDTHRTRLMRPGEDMEGWFGIGISDVSGDLSMECLIRLGQAAKGVYSQLNNSVDFAAWRQVSGLHDVYVVIQPRKSGRGPTIENARREGDRLLVEVNIDSDALDSDEPDVLLWRLLMHVVAALHELRVEVLLQLPLFQIAY